MTRTQLENIYKANGIFDFKLKNTDDLFKVHGIDFRAVTGLGFISWNQRKF